MDNQSKIKKSGNSYILYDAELISDPTVQLFDADYHTKQDHQQNNSTTSPGIGRAKVVYFSINGRGAVLKHYFRGGAIASILKDHYLGFSIVKSRSFREWRLLKKMHELNLPVPAPVAAHVKKGLLWYQADLITIKIEDSQTLSDVLSQQAITSKQWSGIGACIKSFHRHDIYHADLNARNILLTPSDDIYLIDFDNSGFRVSSESWKMANLARLKRSLLKFKNNSVCNFNESDWDALLEGYKVD